MCTMLAATKLGMPCHVKAGSNLQKSQTAQPHIYPTQLGCSQYVACASQLHSLQRLLGLCHRELSQFVEFCCTHVEVFVPGLVHLTTLYTLPVRFLSQSLSIHPQISLFLHVAGSAQVQVVKFVSQNLLDMLERRIIHRTARTLHHFASCYQLDLSLRPYWMGQKVTLQICLREGCIDVPLSLVSLH